MKIKDNLFPKSSFLSMEKDTAMIVNEIMGNQRLLKLLYYTEKDCLNGDDLTAAQAIGMLGNQIKLVPKLNIDTICPIFVVINFDNFIPNENNPEFRDCTLSFDILCHPDHWELGDFKLRPYKIAGELDAMFDQAKLTGIGTLNLMGAQNLILNDNLMGTTLLYKAIHGIEDKIDPLS